MMENQTLAIELKEVSYLFQDHLAIGKVNFRVTAGSIHGFIGPNGAGKTTTIKLICTLLPPQKGSVLVFGHDVATHPKAIRQIIGFMPDHFSMYRQMTVREYLDFFGAAYGLSSGRRDQVIGEILSLVDLENRQHDLVQELSRGLQQRVSVARVLVNDPQLLVLDEPASGLDPRARLELMEILKTLRSMGKTIFISSHILSELGEVCDELTIIDRGEVRYNGSITELLAESGHHCRWRVTLGSVTEEQLEHLVAIPGVLGIERTESPETLIFTLQRRVNEQARLLSGMLEAGLSIISFQVERKNLGEVFLSLTTPGVRT